MSSLLVKPHKTHLSCLLNITEYDTRTMDATMRTIGLFLLLVLLGLQYKLWFGDGSVLQSAQLAKQLALQEEANNKLAARNRAVEADISELKSGDQALEEQARYDLGMVKQGETYYQFVD